MRTIEKQVGSQWLITSPDVPGLYVAHADLAEARNAVPAAVEMLERMAQRRAESDKIKKVVAAAS